MDAPIIADFSRYLASRFDNPPAYAQAVDHPPAPPSPPDPRAWSTTDKAFQAALVAAQAADYMQTQSFLHNDPTSRESNPVLGNRPSPFKLAAIMAASQLAHGLISDQLTNPWRRLWQLGGLAVEGNAITQNHLNGVRIRLNHMY